MLILGIPADCSAIYNRGEHTSGVYAIRPNNSKVFNVYCDIESGKKFAENALALVQATHYLLDRLTLLSFPCNMSIHINLVLIYLLYYLFNILHFLCKIILGDSGQ